MKGKVQRISVLEKDFVGTVASCNMASLSVCDVGMIMVTIYVETLCVMCFHSGISFMQRNFVSWEIKLLATSLNFEIGRGSYMN